MINNLFIDIETIPGNTFMVEKAISGVSPPANYKKPETIAQWQEEQGEAARKAAVHSLGMHPAFCQIVCLSWALDDNSPTTYHGEDEKALLSVWLDDLAESLEKCRNGYSYRLIGHNVLGFDLPVIWFRCMVNGINSPLLLNPRTVKPWETLKAFDTLYQLGGGNNKGFSLANMAKLLKIPDKYPDIDGSMVWDMWQQGRHNEVADYCEEDVKIVRRLFNAMKEFYL
jgi:hypothetical protein